MVKYLLEQLERSSNLLFSKRELISLSPQDFQSLSKRKIFSYFNPPEGYEERVRQPRCPHGCALTVVKHDGELEGICLDHPEEDPVPIEKDNLGRYLFSMENFLAQICMVNKIDDGPQKGEEGYFYLGYKVCGGLRVGFVFVHNIGRNKIAKLSGLKHIYNDDVILVVFTSVSRIGEGFLKEHLGKDGIIQATLVDCLNPETFELPIDKLISGILKQKAREEDIISILPITEKERPDYDRYRYKGWDILTFLNEKAGHSSFYIQINGGKKQRIKYAPFLLLLFLAIKLKQDKGGRVKIDTTDEVKVTNSYSIENVEDLVYQLRDKVASYLKTVSEKDFIEIKGRKVRLSTHPSRIHVPHERWLKDTFKEVKNSLLEKRKNRKVQRKLWKK